MKPRIGLSLVLALAASTLVSCGQRRHNDASSTKDLVWLDSGSTKESRLVERGDKVRFDDEEVVALEFYVKLTTLENLELNFDNLDMIAQATVDRWNHAASGLSGEAAKLMKKRAKLLQGLVNLRSDLADPAKEVFCMVNANGDSPGLPRYQTTCAHIKAAFGAVMEPTPLPYAAKSCQTADEIVKHVQQNDSLVANGSLVKDLDRHFCVHVIRNPRAQLATGKPLAAAEQPRRGLKVAIPDIWPRAEGDINGPGGLTIVGHPVTFDQAQEACRRLTIGGTSPGSWHTLLSGDIDATPRQSDPELSQEVIGWYLFLGADRWVSWWSGSGIVNWPESPFLIPYLDKDAKFQYQFPLPIPNVAIASNSATGVYCAHYINYTVPSPFPSGGF